jgi:acyl carrier protein
MSTFDTIREMIIDQFQLEPAQITPEATLESLKIDSLAAVEFMFLLEEKYHVTAPMEHIELRTVQDVVNEIDKLVAEQHGAVAATHAANQAAKKDAA